MSLDRFAQSVKVKTRVQVGTDKYNNKKYDYVESVVSPVLVMPTEGQEIEANTRNEGYLHRYTLTMPKNYKTDLDNALISVDGGTTWLDVIDASAPVEKSPLKYGRTVRIGVVNG